MNKQEALKRLEEIKQEQAELEEIINKPERWQDKLVQPNEESYFYIHGCPLNGLKISYAADVYSYKKDIKPEHVFRTKEQAELIKDKMLLIWEMHQFAHVRNEDWKADWENVWQDKWGLESVGNELYIKTYSPYNPFVFGIAVKSEKIAGEMLSIFEERIEAIYTKQY